MSPETIAAVFTGLTGLIAALAAFTANRSRRIALDQRSDRRRIRSLERRMLLLTQHVFDLELLIARSGGKVPPRPDGLDDDDDEDDIPTPSAMPPTTEDK